MPRPRLRPEVLTLAACAALAGVAVLAAPVPAEAGATFVLVRRGGGGGGGGNEAAGRAAYAQVMGARQDLWRAMADARRATGDDPALADAEQSADQARGRYIEIRRRAVAAAAGDPGYRALRREVFLLEQQFPDIVPPADAETREADGYAQGGDDVVVSYAADPEPAAPPVDRFAAAHVLLEARNRLTTLRRELVERDPDLLDAWYAMQDAEGLAADRRADLAEKVMFDPAVTAARSRLAAARRSLAAVGD